jgi:hydrogenase maturation protease
MPIKVVFVGNPMVGDDGIGNLLYSQLNDDPRLSGMNLFEAGASDLISLVRADDRLVLVDAVRSPKDLGNVTVFTEEDLPTSSSPVSAHDFGIEQSLGLLRLLHPRLPPITVIGINVVAITPMCGLSPQLVQRIPAIREQVIECLLHEARPDVLCNSGKNNPA